MIRFIDEHQDRHSGNLRWGIEPIVQVLGIAPSTHRAAETRPLSARVVRDAKLRPLILRVWEQDLAVYGADKEHHEHPIRGGGGGTLVVHVATDGSEEPR